MPFMGELGEVAPTNLNIFEVGQNREVSVELIAHIDEVSDDVMRDFIVSSVQLSTFFDSSV